MKILLIAGHGQGDPGAVGCGYEEADLTREVAQLVKSRLERFAEVTIADMSINWFKNRTKLPLEGIDYVLEIHFNACVNDVEGDGKTTGTEIYVTTLEKGTAVEDNIVTNISSLGLKLRRPNQTEITRRKNWSVIHYIKNKGISSALLETCFIDDKDDMLIYLSKKGQIADAITKGIVDGFGLQPVEEPTTDTNELTSVNDIVWELSDGRGIITDKELWLKKLEEDTNAYWLARKCLQYIRTHE